MKKRKRFHEGETVGPRARASHCIIFDKEPHKKMEDLEKLLKGIPERAQRQDSTERQLRHLRAVANKLGMQDAEKAIRDQFFKEEIPNR